MISEQKTKFILIGGLISALSMVIPGVSLINCFCCAGIALGGYFSVYFYHRAGHGLLSTSEGALMGLMSGVFGGLLFVSLNLLIMQAAGLDETERQMKEFFEGFSSSTGNSEVLGQLESVQNFMHNNFFLVTMIEAFFYSILFGVFSLLGGLLRASQDQKKQTPPPTFPVI